MTSSSTNALALSILALWLGPLLYIFSRRARPVMSLLDGFVMTAVGSLVLLDLGPRVYETAGFWAMGALALGTLFPPVVEKLGLMALQKAESVTVVGAVLGVVVHATLDGVALGLEHQSLSLAVVIHRLPVGLLIWWLLAPNYGWRWPTVALVLFSIVTTGGYLYAEQLVVVDNVLLAMFEAFVAGALLHVLFGHALPGTHAKRKRERALHFLGAAGGFALVLGLDHASGAHHANLDAYWARFMDLCLESSPALLLGYAIAGLVASGLPEASLRWVSRGPPLMQAARGTIFGIPIPICSCGVVPVYQSLVDRGVPAAAGMAFLVATPELGIESVLLSVPLLGAKLTGARLVAATVAALFVGWFVGRGIRSRVQTASGTATAKEHKHTLADRVRGTLRAGFIETVDQTSAWILLGLAIAAAIDPGALAPMVRTLPSGTDVILAGVLGLPFYICASGATPLAAALLYAGLSPGAAVAFLLAGPATNVTTFGVLSRLHGRRTAIVFGAALIVVAIVLGFATNLLLGSEGGFAAAGEHAEHGLLNQAAMVILGGVFMLAMLRRGLRGYLRSLIEPHHDHGDGDEACDDGCHEDGEQHHDHHHHH